MFINKKGSNLRRQFPDLKPRTADVKAKSDTKTVENKAKTTPKVVKKDDTEDVQK